MCAGSDSTKRLQTGQRCGGCILPHRTQRTSSYTADIHSHPAANPSAFPEPVQPVFPLSSVDAAPSSATVLSPVASSLGPAAPFACRREVFPSEVPTHKVLLDIEVLSDISSPDVMGPTPIEALLDVSPSVEVVPTHLEGLTGIKALPDISSEAVVPTHLEGLTGTEAMLVIFPSEAVVPTHLGGLLDTDTSLVRPPQSATTSPAPLTALRPSQSFP